MVAKNSRSRCKEQDIPFFRFSPRFEELIAAGETDNEKLLNMVISTKMDLQKREKELEELVNIFHAVAESSKGLEQEGSNGSGMGEGEDEVKVRSTNESIPEEQEEGEELPMTPQEVAATQEGEGLVQQEVTREGLVSLQEEEEVEDREEVSESPAEDKPQPERESENGELSEEEDKTLAELIEGVEKEGDSDPCPNQEEFAENFLFNSISGALDLKDRGGERLNLLRESYYSSSSNSDSPSPDSVEMAVKDVTSPGPTASSAYQHSPLRHTSHGATPGSPAAAPPMYQHSPLRHTTSHGATPGPPTAVPPTNQHLPLRHTTSHGATTGPPAAAPPTYQHSPLHQTTSHGANKHRLPDRSPVSSSATPPGHQPAVPHTPGTPHDVGVNKNQVLTASGHLYQHYRIDTNQVDESHEEYTEYKRETLV